MTQSANAVLFAHRKAIFLVVLVCTAVTSVSADWEMRRKRRYDCSRQLSRAIAQYNKGHYYDAKTILTETKVECSGNAALDSILYYLGMSLLFEKTPAEAKVEFDELVGDFPNSPFSEEAHFRLAHCSFLQSNPPGRDQSDTKDAIREFTEFIDHYPTSAFADSAKAYLHKCNDKLAEKEFMSAQFYERIEQYEAAIVYYRAVISDYPDSRFAAEATLSLALSLSRVSRPAEAQTVLENLLAENTNPDIQRRGQTMLSRLKQTGSVGPSNRIHLYHRPGAKTAASGSEVTPASENSPDRGAPQTGNAPAKQEAISSPVKTDSTKTDTVKTDTVPKPVSAPAKQEEPSSPVKPDSTKTNTVPRSPAGSQ